MFGKVISQSTSTSSNIRRSITKSHKTKCTVNSPTEVRRVKRTYIRRSNRVLVEIFVIEIGVEVLREDKFSERIPKEMIQLKDEVSSQRKEGSHRTRLVGSDFFTVSQIIT